MQPRDINLNKKCIETQNFDFVYNETVFFSRFIIALWIISTCLSLSIDTATPLARVTCRTGCAPKLISEIVRERLEIKVKLLIDLNSLKKMKTGSKPVTVFTGTY